MFTPIRTRRTFEAAIEQIAEPIRDGDLTIGDRLPPERILAAQMDISRPTLRDAMKVLANAGVLSITAGPRGGAIVISDHIPVDLIAEHTKVRTVEVVEILEARRLLESQVAQLAGQKAQQSDFDAMRRTIELQRSAKIERHRFFQMDLRFHIAMARATNNATVMSLMRVVLRRLEIARDMALRGSRDADWALEIHERTLSAIESRDAEAIMVAMDEHLGYLERIWDEATRIDKPRSSRRPVAKK